MKNLEEYINEGAWGYEPCQNDSALDYRADLNLRMLEVIYDECFKKVHGGAFEEGEEVAAAAIVDINNKISDISTRVSNIASGPSIWVGTQTQYNALESIDQSTIYIIKAAEEL